MAQYYSLNIEDDANDTMIKALVSRVLHAVLIIRLLSVQKLESTIDKKGGPQASSLAKALFDRPM